MTTSIDVIDTAVKIGLGAVITGVITYAITKTNQIHESKKIVRDEKVKLIREYALHIEHLESKLNDCILESTEGNFKSANSILAQACNEGYSARSVANLLGSDDLVLLTDSICNDLEDIYLVLAKNRDEMFDKVNLITESKKQTYPIVRELYSRTNNKK